MINIYDIIAIQLACRTAMKLHFTLQVFQGQTGQAEDGGFGLHPSPYDQVVLCLGQGSEAVGEVADQTFDQSRGQNFVPHPAVACACRLRLSFGAPLLVSAGLGSLSSTALKYLGSEGLVCPSIWKNYFFIEICAIMPPARQFAWKKRNILGVKLGIRCPKNHFWIAVAKVAA